MLEKILKKASLLDVLIVFVASISIVSFWRGAWNLLDKYLLPGNFLLSQIVSMGVGILILFLLSRYRG